MKRDNPSSIDDFLDTSTPRRSKRVKLNQHDTSKTRYDPESSSPSLENHEGSSACDTIISGDFTRHNRYYFDDGDIVLKFAQTLFRVHLEKLQSLGGTFDDMFSITHPEHMPRIHGVPYCDLQGLASPREFYFLLAFVYKDLTLRTTVVPDIELDSLHWEATITLLRLSNRYNLFEVRRAAISALQCLFPTLPTPCHFHPLITSITRKRDRLPFLRQFPIEAIIAFKECDVPAMLPMAYYHAAQLPLNDILNGTVERDGILESLSKADIMIVLNGRDQLRKCRRTDLYAWLSRILGHRQMRQGSEGCLCNPLKGGDTCYQFLMQMFFDFHSTGFFEEFPNALDPLSTARKEALHDHLCHKCWYHIMMKCRKRSGQGCLSYLVSPAGTTPCTLKRFRMLAGKRFPDKSARMPSTVSLGQRQRSVLA